MSPTCVRQAELPHTTRLFSDVLYHPERTVPYYSHPFRDLNAYRAAARSIDLAPERRAALVRGMARFNPGSKALDRLAEAGTVAVVTGQQVGLFGGPAYTIYKALHAARLAQWLTENGIPAVPVFWLATEDHDFAEVNHAWVYGAEHRPSRLEVAAQTAGQPVGEVVLNAPPVDGLRQALAGLPNAGEVADLVAEAYRPGCTMGQAFSRLLDRLLARYDIPHLDPMSPEFRALAAPAMRKAVAAASELTHDVLERNRALAQAGYHAQVHVEPHTSLFFLLEDGKRFTLRRNGGGDYRLGARRLTNEELAAHAESLSPNALLRPVIQDSVLPTVAYIGGPAEIAYLAQSEAIYRVVLGRMPVVVPRAGFTILDAASESSLERYSLSLGSFFHGEERLREQIAARLLPEKLTVALGAAAETVDAAVARLRTDLLAFDPTLAKALDTSNRKIHHQVDKIRRKTAREILRRDLQATREAHSLYNLIYPERHLQERLYSILPFLAEHGLGLIDRIASKIPLDCPDHSLLVA
jgi:bacillithiol biosynthesis cysteine-adding enzyme BshC